jgi:macrolide transport system ATP-binding/permease protein
VISFLRKLRWVAQRHRKDDELREELQFHLDEEAEQFQAEGLTQDEARWAALRGLGNIASLRENTRALWTWVWLEQLSQDLRYALRTMRKNRAFTALAVLSLALGIGANTAIYSFMDAILLRSLPVPDPASLVVLNWQSRIPRTEDERRAFVMQSQNGTAYEDPAIGWTSGIFPFPAFELLHKADTVFSSVFAYYRAGRLNVIARGEADVASGEYVSGDYFSGLSVSPVAGRVLVADDDRPGATSVAVVSFAVGHKYFGESSNAVGQSIQINSVPFTIVGVTPPDFFGVDPASAPDFYLPMHTNLLVSAAGVERVTAQEYFDPNYYWIEIMARLRPERCGVTVCAMGGGYRSERSGAGESSGPGRQGWRQRTGHAPSSVFQASVCVADDGCADPGDCVCQYRQPAARTGHGAAS